MSVKNLLYGGVLLFLCGCAPLKRNTPAGETEDEKSFENVLIARSKSMLSAGPCEPSISISPADTKKMAAGAIMNHYYWSEDGGRTWKNDILKSAYGVFGDPALVADWNGNFYYAHLSDPEGKQWKSEKVLDRIVVQKSADGGKTYDSGSFCGSRHPKDQDKQWLAVDPETNNLFCTWTEFDKYNSRLPADRSRILFSKSTDGGKSWSEALAINQFEGDCKDDDGTAEGAVPAVGPNGEVYVAWAWNEKIWFDRSRDGGTTWLKQDIEIAPQPGGWNFDISGLLRCNGLPVLVCDLSDGPDRGALYVNWSDQRQGKKDTDIWLSKSVDGGNTWSKAVRVNDDAPGKQQFHSWLAVDQTTGYLYCIYYDRRAYDDQRTDVYIAVSKDGGETFINLKISKEPFDPTRLVFFGDYSHISAHGGIVRPIWTRMDKGILSVWTAILDGL